MYISFEKASQLHKETIFSWLNKPHVQEFWDNSQEYRDDIVNFIEGRKKPSTYFDGIFSYWIGFINKEPYCLIMTSQVLINQDLPQLWQDHLSTTGTTYSIDFCIGNEKFLGKGLAAPTLEAFTNFFQKTIDTQTDTFFIDPDSNNPRAIHVYEKAGFKLVGEFVMQDGFFKDHSSQLMIKKLPSKNNSTSNCPPKLK